MNQYAFKTTLALLKAEIHRAWRFPLLELAIGFMALIAITAAPNIFKIFAQGQLQTAVDTMITTSIYNILDLLMLPLALFCGILVALSFARDYEQGLMQTLLSSPLSRSAVFIAKFVAVVLPLTLLSWATIVFTLTLNLYTDLSLMLRMLGFTAWVIPIIFLSLMFYGGLAALISLSVRRTIPAALATLITSFILYYISTLRAESIGALSNYLSLLPYKVPVAFIGKVFGVISNSNSLERSLPAEAFFAICIVYAVVFLVPMYLYFTRRFEVRE